MQLINPLWKIWKMYKILPTFSLEIVFPCLASLSRSRSRTITGGDQIAWHCRRRWLLFQWCNDGIIPEALWRVKWRITKPTVKPNVLLFYSPSWKSLKVKSAYVWWTSSEQHSFTSLNPFTSLFMFWLDEINCCTGRRMRKFVVRKA